MTRLHPQTFRADHPNRNNRTIEVIEDDKTSTRSTESGIGTPSISTAASRGDDVISFGLLGAQAYASDSRSNPPPLDSPGPSRVEDVTSSGPLGAQPYVSSNEANAPPLSSPNLPRGDNVIYVSGPNASGLHHSIVYNPTRMQPSVQPPGSSPPVGDTQASGEVKFPEPDISEHPSNRPPSVQLSEPSEPVASKQALDGDAQSHRPNVSDSGSNAPPSTQVPGFSRSIVGNQGSNEIQYHSPCHMTGGAGEGQNAREDNEGGLAASIGEPEVPESWGCFSCCIPIFQIGNTGSSTRESP